MGAYENALKYAQERLQFGKPIGSFQLIQELLAKMLANIVACQCMLARSVHLETEGKLTDAQKAQIQQIMQSTPKGKERRQAIRAILTPDQQAQLKADLQQWKAQHQQTQQTPAPATT